MGAPRSYNLADVWEAAADAVPEREALVVGDRRLTYAALEERANRLAHHLAGEGIGPGDHVALYMANCPEYVEAMLAAFKLRAVPINVNHRYVAGELRHLLADSGAVAVVTQPSLADVVAEVAGHGPAEAAGEAAAGAVGAAGSRAGAGAGGAGGGPGGAGDGAGAVPGIRTVLVTGELYEAALRAASPARPDVARSGDDLYVIYTGGTTGLPKGVVWRQEDAFFACFGGGDPMRLQGPVARPDELPGRIGDQSFCYLPLAPMMHAAAQWTSFSWFFAGGKVVLLPGALDPHAAWRAVEAEKVNLLTVVGDAVARPLLDAWDEAGGYDVSSLFALSNGGAPMAPSTRERVFATLPHLRFTDGFGSSEAGVQGSARMAASDVVHGAGGAVTFDQPAKPTVVVRPDGRRVTPGSGEVGQVLAGGRLPLGYLNDPERTAATFVERDGERWLSTGDLATVAADGSIELRGRESGVINTGGEKVFAEEVEGVLKDHPAVYDAVVVPVPDGRWGSAVAAVVQPAPGATPTLDDLAVHCKGRLAGYKAPKHLVVVDRVVRSPSGKADLRWAVARARESAGSA